MAVKNILTIDVEDWFHVCGVSDYIPRKDWPSLESRVVENTLRILDIITNFECRATFFILGQVAERHPHLVSTIQKAGHEISSHGYAHRRVYTMSPETFREDLLRSIDILQRITGTPVKGYRAPEWSIRRDSLWALDILAEAGMLYDSSMAPLPIIGDPAYSRVPWKHSIGWKRLWEMPPLVGATPLVNLPLGGGWGLRTLPYAYVRSVIQKFNDAGTPALIFLHPREFDPNCPAVKLPFIKRLVLNGGFKSTPERLERLLKDFEFESVSDFISHPGVAE